MSKGGYIGGSTVIRLGSDWFSYSNPKRPKDGAQPKRKKATKKNGKSKAKHAGLKNPSTKKVVKARQDLERKLEENRSKYLASRAEEESAAEPDQVVQKFGKRRKRLVEVERRSIKPRARNKSP